MERKLALLCFVAVCLFASPVAAQDAAVARTFSGVLNDQVRVGAAVANGKLALFFCGDAATVATQTRWLVGPARRDGQLFYKDGWWVFARYDANVVSGWVWAPGVGSAVPFATSESEGLGLYRAVTEHGTSGAIVTDIGNDGVLELQGAVRFPLPGGGGGFAQIVPVGLVDPHEGELDVLVPSGAGALAPVTLRRIEVIDFL